MAWSVSTSVCLPLLLVLCAVGTSSSAGIDLSGVCSKDKMTTVPDFNAKAFQGDWFLSHMTMDVGLAAYRSFIYMTQPLTTPKVRNFLYKTDRAVLKVANTCTTVGTLTELRNATYTTMEWLGNVNGSLKILQTQFDVLATDYTSTMVLLTEPIMHGNRAMSDNHVDIYVRKAGNEPDRTVVRKALGTFCSGALNDVSSASFVKMSYTKVPACF